MLIFMDRLARLMAITGGLVLTVLVGLTCVSVLGRGLNTLGHSGVLGEALGAALINSGVGPVAGDFELVEAGVACCTAAMRRWTSLPRPCRCAPTAG